MVQFMSRTASPPLETLLLPFLRGRLVSAGRCLFLMAEVHPGLGAWTDLECWQPWKPRHDALTAQGIRCIDEPHGLYDMVMLLPSKMRDETLDLFAQAHDHLKEGGILIAAMANGAGAQRYEKLLVEIAGDVHSLSKNKCRVFWTKKSNSWNQGILSDWRKAGQPRAISGTPFIAPPGLFSADRVDAGSALLSAHLPADLGGDVADLGCGWGFLSGWLLYKDTAGANAPMLRSLDLYDADIRALRAAETNITSLRSEIPRRFLWCDVRQGLKNRYDAILANPPFHDGLAADMALGQAFLRQAARALRSGGRLFIVANRHLPYETILREEGLTLDTLADKDGYKILMGRAA